MCHLHIKVSFLLYQQLPLCHSVPHEPQKNTLKKKSFFYTTFLIHQAIPAKTSEKVVKWNKLVKKMDMDMVLLVLTLSLHFKMQKLVYQYDLLKPIYV